MPLSAQPAAPARLQTVEGMIAELGRTYALAIDRPAEVAAFVFAALNERVRVYPTENYYYFRFVHDGVTYMGNFRLDPLDRDNGKIRFAYTEELAEWKQDGPTYYEVLGAADGFQVERLQELVYRVTYRDRSVVFELNDMSSVKPPSGLTGADETIIGPIYDEAAMRFFLAYNRTAKAFLYLLDETETPIEKFDAMKGASRILVGRRTSFAFYRDHMLDRKILIGVFARNGELNTYFDGPFDQLPENFIKGDTLLDAIVDADPGAKGKIDRLGRYPSGSRYAIHPYMHYASLADLRRVDACAAARRQRATYYRCFVNTPR
ncbi:MAG: hypothetical protein KIT36_01110 [Alphaproteobacteria bacterium]|nr:hypothetical protein [Alphaproteobacteria bacterium]